MKKLLILFAILFTTTLIAQVKPKVDWIEFISKTTSQINDIPVNSTTRNQLVYNTDTNKLNLWNGTGWVEVGGSSTISGINDINDVTITNPTTGQSLVWNGTNWSNATFGTGGTETDPIFTAWDKDWNDLINKPTVSGANPLSDAISSNSSTTSASSKAVKTVNDKLNVNTAHSTDNNIHYPQSAISITKSQVSDFDDTNYAKLNTANTFLENIDFKKKFQSNRTGSSFYIENKGALIDYNSSFAFHEFKVAGATKLIIGSGESRFLTKLQIEPAVLSNQAVTKSQLDAAIAGVSGGGTADGNDYVTGLNLTGNTLTATIPNQANQTVDLTPLKKVNYDDINVDYTTPASSKWLHGDNAGNLMWKAISSVSYSTWISPSSANSVYYDGTSLIMRNRLFHQNTNHGKLTATTPLSPELSALRFPSYNKGSKIHNTLASNLSKRGEFRVYSMDDTNLEEESTYHGTVVLKDPDGMIRTTVTSSSNPLVVPNIGTVHSIIVGDETIRIVNSIVTEYGNYLTKLVDNKKTIIMTGSGTHVLLKNNVYVGNVIWFVNSTNGNIPMTVDAGVSLLNGQTLEPLKSGQTVQATYTGNGKWSLAYYVDYTGSGGGGGVVPTLGSLSDFNKTTTEVWLKVPSSDVTSFHIFKDNVDIATVTATSLASYLVSGLTPATTYAFKVVAYNGANSVTSNTINVTTNSAAASNSAKASDFKIQSATPNKLSFVVPNLTAQNVTDASLSDFKIGDGTNYTITSKAFVGGRLELTLSQSLDYWDNISLRYEGTTGIDAFTLNYVDNQIPEPATTITKYVTTTATGGGNGDSEATAWTWQEAFDQAVAGTTVWIKAGDYGHLNLKLKVQGTPTQPIKFIGYKTTTGDITTNYLDGATMSITQSNLNNNWDVTEMPTLTGVTSNSRADNDWAIQLGDKVVATRWDCHNVVLRNIQIEKYVHGIATVDYFGLDFHNIVFDNINGRSFMWEDFNLNGTKSKTYNSFIRIATKKGMTVNKVYSLSNNLKFTNIIGEGGGLDGIRTLGEGHNLFKNLKIFTSDQTNRTITRNTTRTRNTTDYFIAFTGSGNIAIDCHVYNQNTYYKNGITATVQDLTFDGGVAGGHGIGVRGQERHLINDPASYNLIADCSAYNLTEGFYIRSSDVNNNVIKNVTYDRASASLVTGKPDYYDGGNHWKAVSFYGKVNDNIAENITASGCSTVVEFRDDDNEDSNTERIAATNNIARDITANNFGFVTYMTGKTYQVSMDQNSTNNYAVSNGNQVIDGTFTNGMRLVNVEYAVVDKLELKNLNFKDFDGSLHPYLYFNTPPKVRYQNDKVNFINCNFWNTKFENKLTYISTTGEWILDGTGNGVVNPLSTGNTNLNQ